LGLAEHQTPRRGRFLNSQAEEAEGGFAQDVARDAESGSDDEVAEGVRKKMSKENGPRPLAQNVRGEDEGTFPK
jgi:hypothetical protein